MMWNSIFQNSGNFLYGPLGAFPAALFVVVMIWSVVWKGLAMWKSAKNNQRYWFVALLVLSTLGILDIIYIAFFQKKRKK